MRMFSQMLTGMHNSKYVQFIETLKYIIITMTEMEKRFWRGEGWRDKDTNENIINYMS